MTLAQTIHIPIPVILTIGLIPMEHVALVKLQLHVTMAFVGLELLMIHVLPEFECLINPI